LYLPRVSQICILRAANLRICESFFLAPAIRIFADSHMRAGSQIHEKLASCRPGTKPLVGLSRQLFYIFRVCSILKRRKLLYLTADVTALVSMETSTTGNLADVGAVDNDSSSTSVASHVVSDIFWKMFRSAT